MVSFVIFFLLLIVMITLRQITLSRGTKVLLEDASVLLHDKQKIGLVGHNGCGKSSLFSLLLGKLGADTGECLLTPQLRISHLSQQLPDSLEPARDFVLAGDDEYVSLLQQLADAESTGDDSSVLACHERLTQTAGYSKPAMAASIMAGLGFSDSQQQHPVNSFSGGWRMRLSLARCLMKPADLLLLDEPTNHLDMEAIFWLEKWLKQTPASILLISHDREFLDSFVTNIWHIEHKNITSYKGDYSCFEKTRAEQLALQQITYEKQQLKINHLMAYVNRFRAKASKAKQAQSRLTMIDKMEVVAKAQIDSPFSFEFYPCPRAGNPLIRCDKVMAGYDNDTAILKNINLILNPGDRIALLGPNGQGKSTLIKTLTGSLAPINGIIHRSAHLTIGYYAQHQLDELDFHLSPLETIQELSSDAREQTIRDFLGGFNFMGDMAVTPITHFSGGEKARLALAKLVWQKPNVLLLDEPTNHLDLEMRAAIEIALQSYEGALILISHDRHLLRSTVDDFYLVYEQQVKAFKGDLNDYHTWLLSKDTLNQTSAATNNNPYRERKSLQNRLKKLEQQMASWQKQLSDIETALSDLALYNADKKDALQALLQQQATLQQQANRDEEEWMEISETLEQFKG